MTCRLFLAIDLPEFLKSEISVLQRRLSRLNLPITWEPPEKLHLTLSFLGRADPSLFQSLSLVSISPFTLTPHFLDTLYRRHERSLIYLGLAGDLGDLKDLQKSLSLSLSQITDYTPPRRYFPHITIGKFKKADPTATKSFLDRVSEYSFTPLSPFTVLSVTLYRSLLSRSGSTYQKQAQFMLQSFAP